jgi:hypothetical protein
MRVRGRTKSDNRIITFKGVSGTLQHWSRTTGIDRNTLATRLNSGMPVKLALTLKPRSFHKKYDVTHCPKGHPYDDANTVRKLGGKGRKYLTRMCRTCMNARSRKYHWANREKRLAQKAAYRAASRD